MTWKLESCVVVPSPGPWTIETRVRNGLILTICELPGPLCSLSMVVPTESWDNSGLAHTLEHLVFCGSQTCPEKGFLDNLANRSLSNGTNAYTSEDHTCYTMTSISFEGICRVLPVYLDHILKPCLEARHFLTEVYNGQENSGVVYTEMKGRYKSESDLLDNNLRALLYQDSDLSFLGFECGGLPADISRLDIEKIREYHEYYYHPSRLGIIISGPVDSKAIVNTLDGYFSRNQFDNFEFEPRQIVGSSPPEHYETIRFSQHHSLYTRIQEFESSNTSIGSIGLGFKGPELENVQELLCVEILARYLCEDHASPIYQIFVECNPPICSSVDFGIQTYRRTGICLTFNGVETGGFLNQKVLSERLLKLFNELHDQAFETTYTSQKLLRQAVTRHRIKHLELAEEEPHSMVYSGCLHDMLLCRKGCPVSIGSSLDIMHYLEKLDGADIEYWKRVLSRYFICTQWHEVVMVPVFKEESQEEYHKCVDSLKAAQENTYFVPGEICNDIQEFPHNWRLLNPDSEPIPCMPFSCVQLVQTETAYYHLTLVFDLSMLESDYRLHLVLFQELLFQSGMKSDDRQWSSREVIEELNRIFVSYSASVGFDNSMFSCSYLSQAFVISATIEPEFLESAIRFLFKLVFCVEFELEKILATCHNSLSDCIESLRNGSSVIDALEISCFSDLDSISFKIDQELSLFTQKRFLKQAIEEAEHSDANVCLIGALTKIRDTVFGQEGFFVQFGCSSRIVDPERMVSQISLWWAQSSGIRAQFPVSKVLPAFIRPPNPEPFPSRAVICGIGGLTTTHYSQSVLCDVFDRRREFYSVLLLCVLLSRVEGPLFSSIRGKGLAYGVSLNLSLWSKTLSLSFYRAVDPLECVLVVRTLFEQLDQEISARNFSILSEYNLDTARSTFLCEVHTARSSPASILSHARKSLFCGIRSMSEQSEMDKLISSVSQADVIRVYQVHFRNLLQPEVGVVAFVCPLSKVGFYKQRFSDLSINLKTHEDR